MAYKNTQKFGWLFLAILSLGSGVMTLTVYKQSTWSILGGSMQILGGIIFLLVLFITFKKKDNSKTS